MTFFEATTRARALFMDAGILPETALLDADLLARHVLGWDLGTWLARRREEVTPTFPHRYEAVIHRRLRREPVAYIRGVQEFWGREFIVSPAVLIPRPETELLVELAFDHLKSHPRAVVADVGTGSGCIATTIALEHRATTVYAVDISEAALAVARVNAERVGARDRVTFLHGSLLESVPKPVDLVVSNPPYVAERDKPGLSREVRDHEPAVALFGGEDGWRDIRLLLRQVFDALAPDGALLMEIGYGQSEHLTAEVEEVPGLALERIATDLQGIPRVAVIQKEERRTKN